MRLYSIQRATVPTECSPFSHQRKQKKNRGETESIIENLNTFQATNRSDYKAKYCVCVCVCMNPIDTPLNTLRNTLLILIFK